MNLSKPYLEDIFEKQLKLKVPVFQRHYVWNEEGQWKPLWDDFINKVSEHLSGKRDHAHYTGSIVVYKENTSTSSIPVFDIIDGQQRLTTFQIFIAAFREVCSKHIDDDSLTNDFNRLLFNKKSYGQPEHEYESQKLKFEPTKFNIEDFKFIVSNSYEVVEKEMIDPILHEYGIGPKSYRSEARRRSRILSAYLFFYEQLNEFIKESDLSLERIIPICINVLKRSFQFVEIGLEHSDDPQMIFETMNGRGAALSQTDLIRNYVFMRATKENDSLDSIYDRYWDEFDNRKAEYQWHDNISRGRQYGTKLQFFIIDYLTIKIMNDIRYDQVFYHYKSYIQHDAKYQTVNDELADLHYYSKFYKTLTNPQGNGAFATLAKRLNDMDIKTMYPLVLYIEGSNEISRLDKDEYYRILDSFLVRRFLCGLTTKNYNNLFLDYLKFISQSNSVNDFREFLLSKDGSSTRWPSDLQLKESIMVRPIYREEKNKSRAIANIFLEIEHNSRKSKQEVVVFQNSHLHIEHILPQNWIEHWPLNGESITAEDYELARHAIMMEENKESKYHKIENRNNALHSFGNLTILTDALNPSISNNDFKTKLAAITEESTLKINSYFQKVKAWDEEAIKLRAEVLHDRVKAIWVRS